jgi:vitamin B12 transporter
MKKQYLVLAVCIVSLCDVSGALAVESGTRSNHVSNKTDKAAELAPLLGLETINGKMYLTITATRSETNVNEIPAKVEVIGRQEVEQTVGDTITEQLKKNTSMNVIEYPGVLAGIGIRGFRPEFSGITKHSLILVNGRPAGATNLATLLADNVERIEVLKGPASSLYGGEAMGGVVNIITRKNTGKLTGRVEAGFGSYDTNAQKVELGGGLGERFDFDISAGRYDQNDDFKMGDGEIRANTRYETQNGSGRIGANLGDAWRLEMAGDIYQGRDIENPGDIFYGDNQSGYKDIDRYGTDLTLGGKLGVNNKITLASYRSQELGENYSDHFWGSPVPTYHSYDSETSWFGVQAKDEYSWHAHRFIVGVDYQDINVESRSFNTNGVRKAPYSPDEGRKNWAGYLETIWKVMDKRLTVTAGGRYDIFDVETKATPYKTDFIPDTASFSTFSPRTGLNYLFDQAVRLHTTVGKAFVPPTAAQLAGYSERLVYGVTMITRGNPNLDPESSITCDAGVGFEQKKWGLDIDFTVFHTDVDDKISTTASGNTTSYVNSLSAEMEGLESSLSLDVGAPLNWKRSLTFFVNSTHMFKAEEELTSATMQDIHNVAKQTVNYGIQYDDGLFDGKLHFRNQGGMKDTDWNAPGYPVIEYPSFTVADLMVGVTFLDHHRIILKADNLFDKDYYEKTGFPKPGRSFFATYRYEF